MSALQRWQDIHGFSDDEAAQHLGLSLGEFRRQRVVGASRQTTLLAILVALYRPDMAKLAATAASLTRLPTRPEETTPEARPVFSTDLCSDWS